MTVRGNIFVSFEELWQETDEIGAVCEKIRFVENLDGGGEDGEGIFTGIILFLGNLLGKSGQIGGASGDKLLGKGFDFVVGRNGRREGVV